MYKKWLINLSEELDTRNAILNTRTSLKQIPISILIGFLYFQLLERVKNTLNLTYYQIKIYFKYFPASRMVNLASVELSGKLMQETHHIWY